MRFHYTIILLLLSNLSFASYCWVQKSNLSTINRYAAMGFSINGKGYVGCGNNGSALADLWEYNPISNSWTQKANFIGGARWAGVGFSIGNFGYFTLGTTGSSWPTTGGKYDPTTNTWSTIASFTGSSRQDGTGFSVNNNGYIVGGWKSGTYYSDLQKYDPTLNSWTSLPSYPGGAKDGIRSFVIGNIAYVGMGQNSGVASNNLYSFNPTTTTWTPIASFPGNNRHSYACFEMGGKGIVGAGSNASNSTAFADFYEYDPTLNSWSPIPSFPGQPNSYNVCFNINGNGYISTGRKVTIPVNSSQTWMLTQGPNADFSNSASSCGTNISFTNLSTGFTNSNWNFGDGTTSNQSNPIHNYSTSGSYTVTLIVSNGNCTDTITQSINVSGSTLSASFIANIVNCSNNISINNLSTTGVTYSWDLGDGNQTTGALSNYTYTNPGNYTITLVASDGVCTDTTTQNIVITAPPTSSFNIANVCDLNTTIQNNSTNATTYSWDWGDGNQTSGNVGNYQYASPGNYTVTLIASNSACSDTITQNIVVQNSPIANFNIVSYCNNTVTIQNNSSNATNFNWNWGNGQVATGNQTTYQYASNSNYIITLIASNAGCADTTTIQVDTSSVPLASFTATPNCSNGIDITNNSQNSSNFLWLWGDNSQDTGSVQNHTYLASGNYTITLISSSANCTDTTTQNINVSALTSQPLNITSDCNNSIQIANFTTNATSLLWNWGDGQTSNGNVSTHTYITAGNYLVTLILSNATCADTLVDSITIYQRPIADFNLTANCNQSMSITNLTTNFTTLNWNWGNGQTSTGNIQNYTYNNPGPYSVTLIAQNGNCFDTLMKPVVIDTGVVATFSTGTDCNLGLTLLNNSLYADSVSIIWGDGTISNNNLNFHQYSSYGNYTVTLIAYGRNCVDSSTTTISVDTLPVSSILYQLSVCHDTVQLNSEFQSATYLWDFGDGQTSSLQSPFHVYAQSGNYTIQLINSNNNCIDSITQNISIATTPDANFTYNLNCLGQLVTIPIYDNSWSYNWDLGDGTLVNTQNVNHIYTTEGNYLIALTVNNGYCSDTTSLTVNFTYQPTYNVNFKLDTCETKLFIDITPLTYDSIIIDYGDGTISNNLGPFYQYTNFDINQLSIILNPGSQCADTISTSIDLTESVSNLVNYLPNSFTPNGDGVNDLFYLPENKCIDYQYEIFNRWGNLIFETDKSGVYWDGKYNNVDLPEGVYIISVKSKYNTTLATVTILR